MLRRLWLGKGCSQSRLNVPIRACPAERHGPPLLSTGRAPWWVVAGLPPFQQRQESSGSLTESLQLADAAVQGDFADTPATPHPRGARWRRRPGARGLLEPPACSGKSPGGRGAQWGGGQGQSARSMSNGRWWGISLAAQSQACLCDVSSSQRFQAGNSVCHLRHVRAPRRHQCSAARSFTVS